MRLSPLICAHRGRSGVFPENTMAAFEAAVEVGADFMELDVRATVDGEIVCIHDATVDRTTDGSGEVAQMTLAEVQALDAGRWIGAAHAGEGVPLLREVLEVIAPRVVVDIEIKQRGIAEQVAGIVREAGALRRASVISFDREDIRVAKSTEPALACGLITSGPEEGSTEQALIGSALECGASFVSCSHRAVTPTLVRECHLTGLLLLAWTMDEPEDIARMIDLQVDGLVSNYPERVAEMLGG
ncbi:MAG: glycerophosphodiester phosphodiesterase [Armatimonadota bacterium]|jgi:glycerophosphoryl diester phosphodiesterase